MLHLDLDRVTEEETFVWNNDKRKSEKVVKQANGFVIFKAIVKDGKGGIATGTKSEKAASFPDYIEKAETGAIGRALAALGYGTQFAPELSEEHRIVDSPVEPTAGRTRRPGGSSASGAPGVATGDAAASTPASGTSEPAAAQQLESIRKLCVALKKDPPDGSTLTAQAAGQLISALTNEYKAARARAATPATR